MSKHKRKAKSKKLRPRKMAEAKHRDRGGSPVPNPGDLDRDLVEAQEVKIAPQAMRVFDFMKAPNDVIDAKTVDCDVCPVSMLCQAGEGGSGRVCEDCRSTGVPIDADTYQDAKHLYLIDCANHNFPTEKPLKPCNMCDGRILQHEVREPPPTPTVHYVRTKYAKVSIDDRKEKFRAEEIVWRAHYEEKGKAISK